jgi:hypothetical protein
MAQVLKPTPVAQVDANGRTEAHSGGTSRRYRSHRSPLRWHKSTLTVASKPTPVAQADFGRNLKPAPAVKLFVFSDFSFALAFRKVLFVFCILSPPRVAQSRLLQSHLKSALRGNLKSTSSVATQSPLRVAQSRLRFSSHISKSAPRGTKSTSVFKSHSKVCIAGI